MRPELELRNLVRRYGEETVVDDLDLTVEKGELVSLLGPSGCGKTTTLRMVAGFARPSGGQILVRGEDIAALPVHRRGVGLVFQSYALFPHLSVFDNVAFGLKRHKVPRREIPGRVRDVLAKVQLEALADRKPAQLSGGQQQRVALARVLVLEPSLVLLDEPFSNLDALLRETMRSELRAIQQRLGFTALFVTHDQEEAMALSDRIAVMERGRLVQLDRPEVVYHRPATRFVAEFIGRANLFGGTVRRAEGGELEAAAAGIRWLADGAAAPRGAAVDVMVRPDRVALELAAADASGDAGPNAAYGEIVQTEYLGSGCLVTLRTDDGTRLLAEVRTAADGVAELAVGRRALARWAAGDVRVLAGEGDDAGAPVEAALQAG
ncbi:ABC transporter ATP-binding protein [Conexibacter arvalis]|uniref:Spermidine/putrescine import ATP-binding protein PotA n=1 Tax=Conexibacter arvalis TaxID=912552 RepID=A0A840I8K7_9ACTN|nr:ABC transporter ATP-binding protein [Conexibacter arvalis]MBB4660583.1 spermidine/putrescine ABC transporter ATP-binding subunit [Conexibacter arvalis]